MVGNKDSINRTNFTDKYCDNTYNFFIPKIKFKHNKLVELCDDLLNSQKQREANYENTKNIQWEERKNAYNAKIFENPYNYEINMFFIEFSNKCERLNSNFLNYKRKCSVIKNEEDSFFSTFFKTNKIIKMEDFQNENEYNQQNHFHSVFFENNIVPKDNQLKDILNSDQYMYKDLNETNYLYVETYENWKVKE